jgi:hypothetical protein
MASERVMGRHGCTGRSKQRAGQPCDAWPVKGTDKCPVHSGKKLDQLKAEGAVRQEVQRWGLNDQVTLVDPGVVLLRLVTQSAQRAQLLAAELEAKVAEAPNLRDALVGDSYGEFGKVGEYIRGLARLEAEERDRCATFAAKAIAAGLAERQVRLAERQGALLVEVLRASVAGLVPELQEQVMRAAATRLRAIEGGAA